ncbi:MAG: DUF1800 domain-containing protein [Pseudomonadota bacterium]
MRVFDPELAEIRFGFGLAPAVQPPARVDDMLNGLTGLDDMATRFPVETFDTFRARMVEIAETARIRRTMRGTPQAEAAKKRRNQLNAIARKDGLRWAGHMLLRQIWTPTAFRERLVGFWADHFTAHGKQGVSRRATSPYIEEAIRPNIAGNFADLLQAAVMHPVMLFYLDQTQSMGPGSVRGKKRKNGLNENLAREVLELHTLGVHGPYTQNDVQQLAELLTGLSFRPDLGFVFRKDFVEPGSETILGQTYQDAGDTTPIRAVLRNLARHPATARHLAQKLAVHFVSDTPDADLVKQLEATFNDAGGNLLALYEVLLNHPAAWQPTLQNVKPPLDFMASAMRSLAVPEEKLMRFGERKMRRVISRPLTAMGQQWQRPGGPDGWPEDDAHWITPQGIAGRVAWAMNAPEFILRVLPDPREFVATSLGRRASDLVHFAAASAENRPEGIGLVLMSPAFQRR